MSTLGADAERRFLVKLSAAVPGSPGYRDSAARRGTDEGFRDHVAGAIEALRAKLGELKAAAEDEGEEDMIDDLDRVDARMERTASAMRTADYGDLPFFGPEPLSEEALGRVSEYDLALLQDVDLLVADVMGLKYETIGNLTLREIEGTLAAIELKVTNRRDIFEISGRT